MARGARRTAGASAVRELTLRTALPSAALLAALTAAATLAAATALAATARTAVGPTGRSAAIVIGRPSAIARELAVGVALLLAGTRFTAHLRDPALFLLVHAGESATVRRAAALATFALVSPVRLVALIARHSSASS